jgi:hypothetical protein
VAILVRRNSTLKKHWRFIVQQVTGFEVQRYENVR